IAVFICGEEKFTYILARKSHIFEVEDLNRDESVKFFDPKTLRLVMILFILNVFYTDIKEDILLEVEKNSILRNL
ncbi:hypothetical protein C1646_703300, partial [Rhizophagus diaphanus]